VSKLKIGAIEDDKPVTVTIKLPAAVHRDLRAYAEVLKREGGQPSAPAHLPMALEGAAVCRASQSRRGRYVVIPTQNAV
jgi:hypothetical protein